MEERQTPPSCPKCGAALSADAPQGLCPACLLERVCSEAPAEPRPAAAEPACTEKPGDRIGRYELLEQIGEGGFGIVYMAEQVEPVQRKVALKIVKAGMDTHEVIARFEAERQALALMDNPNIARVFDGGVTQAGRPYFVMELVRGVPITAYCDQRNLSTRERLALFIEVCKAVQHAHQKGIIHRDLKPSNILVTHQESDPLPKVIDFGVAKALGQKLTDKTLFTGFLRMVGTPAYMSPEQAEMSGMDIDTRSDIYSLGVLLYELLTGVTPFDAETFRNAALDEVRRVIRETEPPKPSTRLTDLVVADVRRLKSSWEPDRASRRLLQERTELIHRLRGDLDWIVMKCLEKDRRRRYETANGLAMDVQRHLQNEPVVARPPSAGYRLQKLIRRNKLLFAAGGAVAASLLTGLAISSVALLRERSARHEAVMATRDKQEQLWRSQLIEARYYRTSGQRGQQTKALNVIGEAVKWRPSVELRNEAIAALLLPDLGTNVWFLNQPGAGYVACDADFELYVPDSPAGQIQVWRIHDETLAASLEVGTGEKRGAQFSPNGRRLAVFLGRDGTNSRVSLWDWRAGRRLLDMANGMGLGAYYRPVYDFTPDGHELVVATRSGPIRRFDAENGGELQPPLLAVAADSLRLSPSGQAVAVYDKGELQVWSLTRSQQVARCALPEELREGLHDMAWHPHEELLAIGTDVGLFLWKLGAKDPELISTERQFITRVFFNPNGDLLLAGAWGNFCGIWDAGTGRLLLSNRGGAPLHLSRDGSTLAYVRERIGIGAYRLLHPRGLRRLLVPFSQSDNRETFDAQFHPSGRWLLSAHHRGWLLWDPVSARIVGRHRGGRVSRARFLPDGSAFITCGHDGVQRWPLSSMESDRPRVAEPEMVIAPERFQFHRIALAPDGTRFAAASDGTSLVCQIDGSSVVRLAGSERRPAHYVYFSPDGRWVMTGHHHGTRLNVYDATSGQHVRDLPSGGYGSFQPDGHGVVGAGPRDYTFWRVGTWELVRRIPWDDVGLNAFWNGFSHDGRYYLIGDLERHLRLRDASTHLDFATFIFPETFPHGSCFDPSGQRLVVNNSLTELFLWDLAELRRELARLGLDWPDEHPGEGFIPPQPRRQ